jgi:phytoene synthase
MSTVPWLDTIAPPGSDNYYALRKIETEKQQAIKIILALFDTIMQIPFTLSDDNIVRIKLRWWKEEIIKTQQGHASHPLCIALFPVMEKYQLNYNALLQMISAIEDIVQNCQFPTEQALRDFYTYTYGIRERMIAKIISSDASKFSEAIHHFAYSLALIDNLKNIRQRAMKTYAFFSDEEARELGVDKNLVLTLKMSEPLKKLFEYQIEKAEKNFQVAQDYLITPHPPIGTFSRKEKGLRREISTKQLLPIILRVHLGLKWCELVHDEGFTIFTHQVELTPVRKWWYCWRDRG